MSNGTLVVGQSGGATAVINASLAGVIETAQASSRFDRILGMRRGMAGLLDEDFIDLTHAPPDLLISLRQTPGSALGTSRLKLSDEQIDRALDLLQKHDAHDVALIGGNDSAVSARRLHDRGGGAVCSALAPKTVDNDLVGTDFCPGFPSAARFLANLVRDATWDSLSAPNLYPVKLIEVPGRDAGWLPVSGALGFAEHDVELCPLVFVPEAPPASPEAMVAALVDRVAANGFVVAIVPETLRDASGSHLGGDEPEYIDPFGHPYFASAGEGIARLLRNSTSMRARVERPGSATRASMALASTIDQSVAYLSGRAAVEGMIHGLSGVMAGVERDSASPTGFTMRHVDLHEVANRVRSLPQAYFDQRRLAPTNAFADYALPLLGADPFPPYARLAPAS